MLEWLFDSRTPACTSLDSYDCELGGRMIRQGIHGPVVQVSTLTFCTRSMLRLLRVEDTVILISGCRMVCVNVAARCSWKDLDMYG